MGIFCFIDNNNFLINEGRIEYMILNGREFWVKYVYIYLDDLGLLHKNEWNKYFVYGGYAFLGSEKDNASRKYKALENKIKKSTNYIDGLQIFTLTEKNYKNVLDKVLKDYQKISRCVNIGRNIEGMM